MLKFENEMAGDEGSLRQTVLRRLLIAAEGALAAFLLVGAGSLLHSFANLAAVDPGFRPERLLTFRVTLERPTQEARRAFYTEVLDRVRALPGLFRFGGRRPDAHRAQRSIREVERVARPPFSGRLRSSGD
jgi:hypothetical protein